MMNKKSNINTLLYYAANEGMERLLIDFESGLEVDHRDYSKDYDDNDRVIYFYPAIAGNDNTHIGFDYQAESVPRSFDDHVKRKINREYNAYLTWLNEIFETQEESGILSKIVHHQEKIRKLFNSIDDEETLPRVALRKIAYQLADYYQMLVNGETIEQQREKITKTKIYERYWELRNPPSKMDRAAAYKAIYTWLIKNLQFTEEEVKKRTGVNLEESLFIRNTDNQTEIKNRISAENRSR